MQAASRAIPATRRCSRATPETSITACVQPLSTMRASQVASSWAGGVVQDVLSTSRPSKPPKEPRMPTVWPAVVKMLATRQAVVVFPPVPPTAMTFRRRLGLPATAWHTRP